MAFEIYNETDKQQNKKLSEQFVILADIHFN